MNNRYDTGLRYIKAKDLVFVILYGAVLSILFGIMVGFLDYFMQRFISISFAGILFFLSSMQIGKLVRKQYEFPHLVYIIITGVFLVVQALIIYFLPIIFRVVLEFNAPEAVFNVELYIYIIKNFFTSLLTQFNFNLWLTVLVFSIGTYLGIKQTY